MLWIHGQHAPLVFVNVSIAVRTVRSGQLVQLQAVFAEFQLLEFIFVYVFFLFCDNRNPDRLKISASMLTISIPCTNAGMMTSVINWCVFSNPVFSFSMVSSKIPTAQYRTAIESELKGIHVNGTTFYVCGIENGGLCLK